jgi:hypothetical protein
MQGTRVQRARRMQVQVAGSSGEPRGLKTAQLQLYTLPSEKRYTGDGRWLFSLTLVLKLLVKF